jgi:hypothetical protein
MCTTLVANIVQVANMALARLLPHREKAGMVDIRRKKLKKRLLNQPQPAKQALLRKAGPKLERLRKREPLSRRTLPSRRAQLRRQIQLRRRM